MTQIIKQTKYGIALKKNGRILTYSTRSNNGSDFCGETQTELQDPNWEGQQWLVDQLWHAEWVRTHSTPWYNAGYDTPTNFFKAEDLVVVKVVSSIEIETADTTILASEEDILKHSWGKEPIGYEATIESMLKGNHGIKDRKEFIHMAADYYRTWEYYGREDI